MTSLLIGLLWWLSAAVAPGAPAPGPGAWEKLYEARSRDSWISAVWLAADGTWRAGGPGFIVSGGAGELKSTNLGDFHVSAFGEDASGTVVAVGSRQAIWEEVQGGLKRVHERAGPPQKGRAAHEDVLDGIGYLDPENPQRQVAYGGLHLSFWRDPGGTWRQSEGDALAKLGTLGPAIQPPPDCHIAGWHWLDRASAFFECHEGSGGLYRQGAAPMLLGRRLPAPCRTSVVAAARNDATSSSRAGRPRGSGAVTSTGRRGRRSRGSAT